MSSTCKLCRSFADSQFETAAKRGLLGSDTFSRDPDICDACLNQNYTEARRFGSVEAFCLMVGLLGALLVSTTLVARGFVPVASSPVVSIVLLTACGAAVIGGALWLLLRLFVRVGAGSVPQDPKERQADAERFYWLAVWASLTGRGSLKRRMLKQAKSIGFNDPERLSDPRLGGMA